ncbi:MAG: iron response transcriptional regulator IrrA [Alphaproteobacteria bacterium]
MDQVGANQAATKRATQDATQESGSVCVLGRLRKAGLRPTRQRVALAGLLYGNGDRHITAERLHEEAVLARIPVSLATIYNTLHQFTEAGLLRQLLVDGTRTYFDTNTSEHHHYFVAANGTLSDIPGQDVKVVGMPPPPKGMRVERVDVVVRLAEIDGSDS